MRGREGGEREEKEKRGRGREGGGGGGQREGGKERVKGKGCWIAVQCTST